MSSDFVSYDTIAEQHGLLQQAFAFFNHRLFDNSLPQCVITMQRKRSAHGYFSAERFASRSEEEHTVDEIAMNPKTMHRDDVTILSTLVHEMVHLWQQHHGKPGRGRYHNKEWASKMRGVGLHPVSYDNPGRETGQRVSHTIITDGRFALAAAELPATNYTLQWRDATTAERERTLKKKNKVAYVCGSCDTKVWGKPGLKVLCGECDTLLTEQSESENA